MRLTSEGGKPWRPSTFFHDWFIDLITGTKDVLDSADRLRLTEPQKKSIEAEVALYSNLLELVDGGVAALASLSPPVSRDIVEQIRAGLDRWTNRVTSEVDDLPITKDRRSEFTETLKTADVIRAYLESYPVAQP